MGIVRKVVVESTLSKVLDRSTGAGKHRWCTRMGTEMRRLCSGALQEQEWREVEDRGARAWLW